MADKRCAVIAMEKEYSTLENIFLALTDDSSPQENSNENKDSQDHTDIEGEI